MNAQVLTLVVDDAPSAATARERAQRCLDRCLVNPADLPAETPHRIIHDLLHRYELESDTVEELEQTVAQLERDCEDNDNAKADFDDFFDAVREAITDARGGELSDPLTIGNIPDVLRRLLATGPAA